MARKNKEREAILRKYNIAVQNFEKTDIFADWVEWVALPKEEQDKRRAEWEKYYEDVRETVAFAIFTEQREAMAAGDWVKVKDLASQVRQMRVDGTNITLPKPRFRDPFDFENEMREYWTNRKRVRELLDVPDISSESSDEIFDGN